MKLRVSLLRQGLLVTTAFLSLLISVIPDTTVQAACNPAIAMIRVSVSSSGEQSNQSALLPPSISGDGRYAAFDTYANNLVGVDSNGKSDVFVYDRENCIQTRVSVATNGAQFANLSGRPSLSADGRYVTFTSHSFYENCAVGVSHSYDILIHDQLTGETHCVSVVDNGSASLGNSDFASVSDDGRYVTFYADTLGGRFGSYNQSLYIRDRVGGTTLLVAQTFIGFSPVLPFSYFNTVTSSDGRYASFSSYISSVVPGDGNGVKDVFVKDQQGGLTRVSVATDGTEGNGESQNSGMSADGRYIAFVSDASNLVSDDQNNSTDLFVHDRLTGRTTRESVGSHGAEANSSTIFGTISADGRFVAFSSYASNLVNSSTNGMLNIFVRDRLMGQTILLSKGLNNQPSDGGSLYPVISADGTHVVFLSDATNLVSDDTNHVRDAFVAAVPDIFANDNGAPVRNYYTDPAVALTWSPVSWAYGYELQLAQDTQFEQMITDYPDLPVDTLAVSVTLEDGLYYWRIRAKQKDGNWGAWSTTEAFIVNTP